MNLMKKFMKKSEGFTLVELIVVIAILAILAGVAVPAYTGYINRANKSSDDAQIVVINQAIEAACALNGTTASEATVTVSGNAVTELVYGDGNTSIIADYNAFYAGNTIDLKYYSGLTSSGAVVSGVEPS